MYSYTLYQLPADCSERRARASVAAAPAAQAGARARAATAGAAVAAAENKRKLLFFWCIFNFTIKKTTTTICK